MKFRYLAVAGMLFSCTVCAPEEGMCALKDRGGASGGAIQDVQISSKRSVSPIAEAAAYVFRYYNRKLSWSKANDYAQYVIEACRRYGADPSLVTAIIIKESHAKENARSKYAVGLMQVYWRLHRQTIKKQFPHITSEKILMEPRNNIMVGTWLFTRYMLNSGGDEKKAMRRYLGSQASKYISLVTQYRRRFNERVDYNMQRYSKRSTS
jgi:soluble lytic murein transglycosylase-like protein